MSTQLRSVAAVALVAAFGVVFSACHGLASTSPSQSTTAVTVTGTNYFSAIGQQQQFVATGTLSNGTKQEVTSLATWTLAAGAAGITVSSTGMVTAQGFGSGNVVATYQGKSGSLSVLVEPSLSLSGGKQFFNAVIAPNGANFYVVNLGVGEAMTASLVNQGPQPSVTLAHSAWLFTNYPTCSVLHGQQYPNPTDKVVFGGVSSYSIGDFSPPDTSGSGLGSFISGSTPNMMCVAIYDTRLLSGNSIPSTWTPPTTAVKYIITFGFSGSGTASPQ